MDVDPLALILLVLAAARITRLVVADDITKPARLWVARQPGRAFDWLLDLVSCHWCAGLWASAVTVGAWAAWSHTFALQVVVVTLAIAQAQAMVNEREERRGGDTHA